MYNRSIVASGHPLVSDAAGLVLENGGNAFDGVVAAGFAAAVAEPALTSLGGGGFLLAHSEQSGEDIFFDFFVDVPGKGLPEHQKPDDFFAVTVNFSGSGQDFNIGLGSVAVPGTLKGLLHIHKKLGRMDLSEVLEPAKQLARGHILNEQQVHFLNLLKPIMILHEGGQEIYQPQGKYLGAGETIKNLRLVDFLEYVTREGCDEFYRGDIARTIDREMREQGGLLTWEDLSGYEVYERKPVTMPLRQYSLLTAPEPSMGGTLICLYFALLQREENKFAWGSAEHLLAFYKRMMKVEELRAAGVTSPERLREYLEKSRDAGVSTQERLFSRGTTHVSVADRWGNCASMTCSNGEGSGCFVPGTGVMLNNMMGEDDLHPGGFHTGTPGNRVFSMMSPSLLLQDKAVALVLGSGGSKRIRTAIGQVLEMIVEHGVTIEEAVGAPRMYLDGDVLQLEPGLGKTALEQVGQIISLNEWPQKDVYFGGVHCVKPGACGVGDSRRGGAVAVIRHTLDA